MVRRFNNEECFIISPIGEPNDAVRAHVERVRTEIIDEALKLANARLNTKLKAVRSDMTPKAGNILRKVLNAILSDRLLFVILTYDVRPNVYYELGIAHSAARPVIILKDKRITRQEFDIYHFHTIGYSFGELDSEGVSAPIEVPVELVAQTIIQTLQDGESLIAFEDSSIDPLGKQNTNVKLYDRFVQMPYSDWSRLLNRAQREITLVGTTLLDLSKYDNDQFFLRDDDVTSRASLVDMLSAKILFGGIDVTIVIAHEDNPALESMLKGSRKLIDEGHASCVDERFLQQVKQEIAWSTQRWEDIARKIEPFDVERIAKSGSPRTPGDGDLPREKRGTFRLIKVRHGQIKFRVTMTDLEMVVTRIFYLHGRNGSGPAFRINSDVALYASIRGEVDHLIALNDDITVVEKSVKAQVFS